MHVPARSRTKERIPGHLKMRLANYDQVFILKILLRIMIPYFTRAYAKDNSRWQFSPLVVCVYGRTASFSGAPVVLVGLLLGQGLLARVGRIWTRTRTKMMDDS